MTGYKNESGKLEYQIGVYYVSKSNFGAGQKVEEYSDFSFLKKENFNKFIDKLKTLHLSQEDINILKEQREKEIHASLVRLNNDIYQNEKGIGENDRVYLVAPSIIATMGIQGKIAPIGKCDLKSSNEKGNTDGEIILRKINAFLNEKKLPKEKKDLIVRTLQNTLTTENINKVENGESQLKRVFTKIVDDLVIYYKIGLTTDFTGKLFNEMYGWLGAKKETHIKAEQLLGLELLSSVYMLAILNMILMGDGSSNILNKDSLKDFYGTYGFSNTYTEFPADAFVLNPPYSANGNRMNFVEKALGMMNRGYAASIKMPIDIFIGKSSVQTNIYVFRVNETHRQDDIVKFIDFSNDGYAKLIVKSK